MSIDLIKHQIETQLADFERATSDYAAFMDAWRARNDPSQQRLERFRKAKAQEPAE